MIRAPVASLTEGERTLDGALAHYLARVLRLRAGDAFVAFDPEASRESDASVVKVDHDVVVVRFGALRAPTAEIARELTIVQSLVKGDKCDAIVRDATELGVTRIVVAPAHRSIVKQDAARGDARLARWARIAAEAARQCGRSDTPRIETAATWSAALARVDAEAARFCLYERATVPLAPELFAALAAHRALAFAIGPEGGLEDGEIAVAQTQGWSVVSLGALTLRTETVAAAVLGAVAVAAPLAGARAPR